MEKPLNEAQNNNSDMMEPPFSMKRSQNPLQKQSKSPLTISFAFCDCNCNNNCGLHLSNPCSNLNLPRPTTELVNWDHVSYSVPILSPENVVSSLKQKTLNQTMNNVSTGTGSWMYKSNFLIYWLYLDVVRPMAQNLIADIDDPLSNVYTYDHVHYY